MSKLKFVENEMFIFFQGFFGKHYLQEDFERYKTYDFGEEDRKRFLYRDDYFLDQYVVLNKTDLDQEVQVQVSDFKSGGHIIGKENIEVRFTRDTLASVGRGFDWGLMPDFPKENIPDILDYRATASLAPKTVRGFYIFIKSNIDTPGGIYTGSIQLVGDDLAISLPIEVEVLDLMVEDNHFSINLWQYPFTVARFYGIDEKNLFTEDHLEILREHLRLYKSIGGVSMTTTIVDDPWYQQTYDKYPSMVREKIIDGKVTYDFTYFDAYVDLAISEGVDQQIMAFSLADWYENDRNDQDLVLGLAPGSREWEEYWDGFLDQFVDHLDDKGYFDMVYIGVDERGPEILKEVIRVLGKHKNKDGKILKIASQVAYEPGVKEIYEQIDDLSFAFSNVNSENKAYIKERSNKMTTIYTCTGMYPNSFTRSAPIESDWTILYANAAGAQGYLRWALDAWVEDPTKDVSHWWWEAGDTCLIYPAAKEARDKRPRTSPRFEHLRYGRQMVGKINFLLENLDGQNRTDFEKQVKNLDPKPYITTDMETKEASPGVAEEFYQEVLDIYNGIYSYSKILLET